MMGVDSPKDGSSAMMAVTGFMSAEGLSDLLGTVREHVSNLDISMEHVINYGGPGGKVRSLGTMTNRSAYSCFHKGAYPDASRYRVRAHVCQG